MHETSQNSSEYPSQITFKSVFRKINDYDHESVICEIFLQCGMNLSIEGRDSSNRTFVSYTLTAEFESHEHLQQICNQLAEIKGFMMLF